MAEYEPGTALARLEDLHSDGVLSDRSMAALRTASVGEESRYPLLPPARVRGEEVFLAVVLADDSDSLNNIVTKRPTLGYSNPDLFIPRPGLRGPVSRGSGRFELVAIPSSVDHPQSNAHAVMVGQNAIVDALRGAKEADKILLQTILLKGGPLGPFRPPAEAVKLNTRNFRPYGNTPLKDKLVEVLGHTLAEYRRYEQRSKTVVTVTAAITDGLDFGSVKQTTREVRSVVTDMRATGQHLIVAMAIESAKGNVKKELQEMGIDPKWIVKTGSTHEDIRRAFGLFVQVMAKAASATADSLPLLMDLGFDKLDQLPG